MFLNSLRYENGYILTISNSYVQSSSVHYGGSVTFKSPAQNSKLNDFTDYSHLYTDFCFIEIKPKFSERLNIVTKRLSNRRR